MASNYVLTIGFKPLVYIDFEAIHFCFFKLLGFKVEGPSQAKLDVKKDPATGTMEVTYWPTAPGEYAIHILCNNDETPKSPYMAQITPNTPGFDPNKVGLV